MSGLQSSPIAIIGAGAFGLSTALELSRKGYTDITVFEKDEEVPSRWSAANDLNKIMRAEYEDDFYTNLTIEATALWQTPLYAPYFHRVGFLNCCSRSAPQKAVDTMRRFQASAQKHPDMKPYVSELTGKQDIHNLCWQFKGGDLPGWRGYINKYDGYVHSANALRGIYRECQKSGIRFFLGEDEGAAQNIVYEGAGKTRKATGVRTKSGRVHQAALVIVAVGAAATKIVPEIGSEVAAKSWSVAHVRLTNEETDALRGIPVTYARDLGFFFEPDPKTNLLKLCPMGGGYINTNPTTGISQAPDLPSRGFVPAEDERKMRELLRQTLPHLADRPLVEKSLCWFADTSDSDFVIDYVPQTSSSVILMSGDSGHGFKMFPIVGQWIVNLLNEQDGKQSVKRWRFRSPKTGGKKNDLEEDVSWRVGEVRELSDIQPVTAKL